MALRGVPLLSDTGGTIRDGLPGSRRLPRDYRRIRDSYSTRLARIRGVGRPARARDRLRSWASVPSATHWSPIDEPPAISRRRRARTAPRQLECTASGSSPAADAAIRSLDTGWRGAAASVHPHSARSHLLDPVEYESIRRAYPAGRERGFAEFPRAGVSGADAETS